METIHKKHPGLPVVILTAHGDVALTIKSMQSGAYDYLEKPIQINELLHIVRNGCELSRHNKNIKENIPPAAIKALEENALAGKSLLMREIFKNIGRISINKVNVLINGETGTGKELIARLIHHSGISREHPMITINCASLTDSAPDSELFGYCKGAFPGAISEKIGKFEQAGEGSIFLDDISELSDTYQARILRVLQEQEFEKPGSHFPVQMKARIIAATNKDLEVMVKNGKFREELYYRLKVFTFDIPPLRDRKEDIVDLVNHLVPKLNKKLNKKISKIGEGVIARLQAYDWPGNIRELENTLMQAMVLTHGDVLERDSIVISRKTITGSSYNIDEPLVTLEEVEKIHIKKVLDALKWSKQDAASALAITRPTLNAKIEKYGLVKQ
jgi:two-component system response regulator AtoC